MEVQEPPPSWGLLSRSTQCICQALDTTFITKQLTIAMFLGTVKHPNALRPSLCPWDTQSKKREEKNTKNQILNVPGLSRDDIIRKGEPPALSRPRSAFTPKVNVSQAPVPSAVLENSRESVTSPAPVSRITEVQGISKPPVREESHFRPILQETLDSSSAPPPQRAIKEGSEPASATTTSSAGQSLTTNCSSDESSAIQVEQASKGSKPTSSPFKTQCSLSTAETDSATPPVEFDKAALAPTNATVPEVVSASTPSGPVSTAPGSASGRVVPRARRRLSSSAARRTLTSKGTISTPNSDKCRTVAPAPANATGALELRESADSEVVPTSAPSGPVSTAPSSTSGRVVLQARRCLTANAAQRTLTSKGTISTPNSDKFQTVAPAPANATVPATGAQVPRSLPGRLILQARRHLSPSTSAPLPAPSNLTVWRPPMSLPLLWLPQAPPLAMWPSSPPPCPAQLVPSSRLIFLPSLTLLYSIRLWNSTVN
ncbi:flocculation protein FLO11-like [Anguilla anguilla]|uniref:flocculation protein FLO11-like n=1 Tax=Anguilla anguilla TaxID=7936 RepID=UPI0015B2D579|nr:flocculation protein FLO11-like [Anguilla anguilla]